ncbi:MAG: PorP/SprF family type IX secretion system membrane protein [Bacteroidota bacterium]|nr:PorP/SprF family type IX secretion system membrane protein [Bacteroidota bacterium]
MRFKSLFILFFAFAFCFKARGQDPAFSQFFSSPLNVNPALTGNINADWRMIANIRDQWIGPASPYMTGTISYDTRLMRDKMSETPDKSTFGIGTMLMFDYAMSGIVKSTYASLNLAYNINLIDNYTSKHNLGVGFGAIYGRRYMDFTRVDWEEQFIGTGFNTSLPTGETALSNMKPYISSSAGLTYSISTDNSNFDLGVAAFHLNKPKQTFLEDENQYLAMRRVAHINFETFLNESLVLNTNAIYQYQIGAKYFSVGGLIGYYLPYQEDLVLNAGMWYWSNNAIIPYVGLNYRDMQFGVSYDLTTSKLNQATRKPNTWELSLIIRGERKPSGIIPCPWK